MGAFATWLVGFFESVLVKMANYIIDLVQAVIDGVCAFALIVVSLFPEGPTLPAAPVLGDGSLLPVILNALNWVFPIGYIVQITVFVAAGMLAYIVIAPLARWLKLLT